MNPITILPQNSPFPASPCKPEACATAAAAPAELLTPEQLARRLGISRRSLANWTRRKIVPMLKIGRVCRFDYAKVRAALDQYERPAADLSPESISSSSEGAQGTAHPAPCSDQPRDSTTTR